MNSNLSRKNKGWKMPPGQTVAVRWEMSGEAWENESHVVTKAERDNTGDGVCGEGRDVSRGDGQMQGETDSTESRGLFVNDFSEHRFASHQRSDLLWLGWSLLSWRLAKQVWHFSVSSSLYPREENECGPRINTQPYWQKINTFPLCLASVQ